MAASYPKVMAAIYASAVPPLLAIIRDAPNFCIDWAGTTSLGKTTTLRIAASMWGQPDERRPGPISTWDSTRVGVERRSALFGTLPVILDDTKKANKWDDLGQMVYDIASGHGRTRGSMNSLRETAMYRTVLLSSGESPLNKSTKDGGARARIVQIWGSPFDRTDANDEVARINQLVIGNYGHCGPRLVQILLNNKDRWPLLDAMYRKACLRLSEEAVGNPIASRLATYVASMYVASKVLHQWVGLPEVADPTCPDPILSLYHLAMDEAQGSNLAADAMQDVLGWAVSYQDTFWGQHTRNSRWGSSAPSRGWSGVWNGPFDHLFIITSKLKEVLHRHGYEPVGVIRQWHDLGWLVEPEGGSTSGRPDTIRRINGRPSRCIGINRKAIDAFSSVDPG